MRKNTMCVQGGYSPKNGEPRVTPICQSTTYKYDSSETVGKLFDLEEEGFFYTRIGNPTVDVVEKKIEKNALKLKGMQVWLVLSLIASVLSCVMCVIF